MARTKLIKFTALTGQPNVVEFSNKKILKYKGKWSRTWFKNSHPIVLELACGYGEYTLDLAKFYPEKNIIGVDIKGDRIFKGSEKALERGLKNVGFFRVQIEHLLEYFGEHEIDEIWISFPDPQAKTSDAKKRLTSPRFLELYQQIVRPGGLIHLKTDSTLLYDYTLEQLEHSAYNLIEHTTDLYTDKRYVDHLMLPTKTRYEKKFLGLGQTIKYILFSTPNL